MLKNMTKYQTQNYLLLHALREEYQEDFDLSMARLDVWEKQKDPETWESELNMATHMKSKLDHVNALLDTEKNSWCNKEQILILKSTESDLGVTYISDIVEEDE